MNRYTVYHNSKTQTTWIIKDEREIVEEIGSPPPSSIFICPAERANSAGSIGRDVSDLCGGLAGNGFGQVRGWKAKDIISFWLDTPRLRRVLGVVR